MTSRAEQAVLIRGIYDAGGFIYEPFKAASGIEGNLKVALPEAVNADQTLRRRYVGHIAMALARVDVIAATGGAVDMAAEVAFETGMPLVEVLAAKRRGVKHFSVCQADQQLLAKKPRIGFFEDVTSTIQTTVRASRRLGVRPDVVVAGFRRGVPALPGMSTQEVLEYNRYCPESAPYEVPNDLIIDSIVERALPLRLSSPGLLTTYLPETVG